MSSDLFVTPSLVIAAAELHERFSRASGPGGQGVNTTDSRVELSFDVQGSPSLSTIQRDRAVVYLRRRLVDGVLTVTASEHRSQLMNRTAARTRMAALLRAAIAPPPAPRRPRRISEAANEARLAAKRYRSQRKQQRKNVNFDRD